MANISNKSILSIVSIIPQKIQYIISALNRNRNEIIWSRLLYYGVFLQIGLIYGLWLLFTRATLITLLIVYPFGIVCGFGVSAGVHRLWSHRSYKAKLPLRIILMILQSSCKQHSIYEWVTDHRVHHKYSDTDADPHDSRCGLFFTHLGWMVVKKNKKALAKIESLDYRDIEADSVVMFQEKYFGIWSTLWCYVVPPLIPWYFWHEDPWISFIIMGVARQSVILHLTLFVNSIAHKYGMKPYDKYIKPTDTLAMSIATIGEGYHNFHHVFPWDYRSSELSNYKYNFTTAFINTMAKIGWAYDLKVVSNDLVIKRSQRTGDNSNKDASDCHIVDPVWGWGDTDMNKEDTEIITKFNNLREENYVTTGVKN